MWGAWHLVIHLTAEGGDKIQGGHVLLRSRESFTLLTSLEDVHDHCNTCRDNRGADKADVLMGYAGIRTPARIEPKGKAHGLELQDLIRDKDCRAPGEHPKNIPDGSRPHAPQLRPLWHVGLGELKHAGVRCHGV